MKVHFGMHCRAGYVRSLTSTTANVHDLEEIPKLIRPDGTVVYDNSGYLSIGERPEIKEDETRSKIEFRINRSLSSLNVKAGYDGIN